MINTQTLIYVLWDRCLVVALIPNSYIIINGKLMQRGYWLRCELPRSKTRLPVKDDKEVVKQAYTLANCLTDLHLKDEVILTPFHITDHNTIFINEMELNPKLIRKFHALLKQKGLEDQKQLLINDATGGRTDKLTEMYPNELAQLCTTLEGKSAATVKRKLEPSAAVIKMRAKVIALLCDIGYTHEKVSNIPNQAGTNEPIIEPDYARINSFIQNLGANNPKKKILNFLYEDELKKVLAQVEAYHAKEKEKGGNNGL